MERTSFSWGGFGAESNTAVESVLLVEDNPGDARLVQEAFDSADVDVALRLAETGTEAMTILENSLEDPDVAVPQLVLLDLNLPGMDGVAVLDAIRAHSELASVPVLILTSSRDTQDVRRSYDHAANAYLTKPTSPTAFDELVGTLEKFWFENARLPPTPA